MRVLVTRPAPQARATAKRLATLGFETVLAPVLEIAPTNAEFPSGVFDLLLATSPNAFVGGLPDVLRPVPLVCVGEKTAAAGRARGLNVRLVAADGEALARDLLSDGVKKSVLYAAGRERKPGLEQRLSQNGWRVEVIETYRAREAPQWPETIRMALDQGRIEAALHYSPRSADIAMRRMGRAAAANLRHFCLSEEIAAVCGGWAPAERIASAFHPDEDSLLRLLAATVANGGDEQA